MLGKFIKLITRSETFSIRKGKLNLTIKIKNYLIGGILKI
jgi:hypothetical protein